MSALLGANPGLAYAEGADAFKVLIGHSIARDSNLFRLSDDANPAALLGTSERSDLIRSTNIGLAFKQKYSRQQITAEASVARTDFDRFSFLDHTASTVNGTWRWALGSRWRGIAVGERVVKLTDFADLRVPVKNLNTYQRAFADGYYEFHPDWSAGIGAGRIKSTNDTDLRRINDYTVEVVELGMVYSPRSGNEVTAKLRRSVGDYPIRQVVASSIIDNSYDQYDVEVAGAWQVTGASRLRAVLGYASRQHDDIRQRDFRGITGRATYDWQIDGKTSLTLAARREIDAQEDVNANYILTNGFSVNPTWLPTAKIKLGGKWDYRKRDYKGEPGFFISGEPQRSDRIRTASASATYQPVRWMDIGFTYQLERRTSNTQGVPYRDRLIGASLQFAF